MPRVNAVKLIAVGFIMAVRIAEKHQGLNFISQSIPHFFYKIFRMFFKKQEVQITIKVITNYQFDLKSKPFFAFWQQV